MSTLRAGLRVGDQRSAVHDRVHQPQRNAPRAEHSATRGSRSRNAIANISWCDATPSDTP